MKYIRDIVIIIAVLAIGWLIFKNQEGHSNLTQMESERDSMTVSRDSFELASKMYKRKADSAIREANQKDSLFRLEAKKYQTIKPRFDALIAKQEKQTKNKQVKDFIEITGFSYKVRKYKGSYLIEFGSIQEANRNFYNLTRFKESNQSLITQLADKSSAYKSLKLSWVDSDQAFKYCEETNLKNKQIIENLDTQIITLKFQVKTQKKITIGVGILAFALGSIF